MNQKIEFLVRINTRSGIRDIPAIICPDEEIMPAIVYKYLDINVKHNRRSLSERYAWFSNPLSFNDPFDRPTPFANYLLSTDDCLFQKYYFDQFYDQFGFMDKQEIQQFVDRYLTHCRSPIIRDVFSQYCKNASNILPDKIAEETGVFCTCLVNDDILLWSHYANKHSGICLGFNPCNLRKNNPEIGGWRVKYGSFPIIEPFHDSDEQSRDDAFEKMFLIKAICWEYENEYRLADHHCINRKKIIGDSLESLILGREISAENQEFAIRSCRSINPEVKVFKISKETVFSYELLIKPLETT